MNIFWIFIFHYLYIPSIIQVVSSITKLEEFHDSGIDGVILVNRISWKHFNLLHSPLRRLEFSTDQLFMYSPAFFFNKKSALRSVFNDELRKLRESGMVDHWINRYIEDHKTKLKTNQEPVKLKIGNIAAIFYVCISMYVVSFIVFICELLSVRYGYMKNIIDFLTY